MIIVHDLLQIENAGLFIKEQVKGLDEDSAAIRGRPPLLIDFYPKISSLTEPSVFRIVDIDDYLRFHLTTFLKNYKIVAELIARVIQLREQQSVQKTLNGDGLTTEQAAMNIKAAKSLTYIFNTVCKQTRVR